MEFSQQVRITDGPGEPPVYTVGPFVLMPSPDAPANGIALFVDPAIEGFAERLENTPPWVTVQNLLHFSVLDSTPRIVLTSSQPERRVSINGRRCLFKLLAITHVESEGQQFPAYDILACTLDPGEATDDEAELGRLLMAAEELMDVGGAKDEEALSAYRQVLARFATAPFVATGIARGIANATNQCGCLLIRLGRLSEALEQFNALLGLFAPEDMPVLGDYEARAMFNKAYVLQATGDPTGAATLLREIVTRFKDSSVGDVQDLVAESTRILATTEKAEAVKELHGLWKLAVSHAQEGEGHESEAMEGFQSIVTRFADVGEGEPRRGVLRAINARGEIYLRMKRPADALREYEDVLERIRNSPDQPPTDQLPRALFHKAIAHLELGQVAIAQRELHEFVLQFEASEEAHAGRLVKMARDLLSNHPSIA